MPAAVATPLSSVLVTGAAGFIGFHLSQRLLQRGTPVLGFDNLNPYYDPALKRARLAHLQQLAASNPSPTSSQPGGLRPLRTHQLV
jgi:nucleoside-diphosphate-sugar epimerase